MLPRALLAWCLLLSLAVINGGIREAWIVPRTGDAAGHAISTVMLCMLILALSWAIIGWVRPLAPRDAWMIGGLWVALTLAFEFLAGHYLFGHPWSRLLQDYNIVRGRIWMLVLATTLAAPWLAAHARRVLAATGSRHHGA